jgi:hypothetical protein
MKTDVLRLEMMEWEINRKGAPSTLKLLYFFFYWMQVSISNASVRIEIFSFDTTSDYNEIQYY